LLITSRSDKAGTLGITVASDKTLLGEGDKGVIKGKGLRIVSGAKNIIIQCVSPHRLDYSESNTLKEHCHYRHQPQVRLGW
jgi:pectate lyase